MPKTIDKALTETHYRSVEFVREEANDEEMTIPISLSSEARVERWWGLEILEHKKGSIRLDRAKRGLALLVDHDYRQQIGRIEGLTIGGDNKLRGVARFSRNNPRAAQEYADVKDGIRGDVSIGYRVHKLVLVEENEDSPNVYRATDWEPLEGSLVAIPADISVGAGRSQEPDPPEETNNNSPAEDRREKGTDMDPKEEKRSQESTKTDPPATAVRVDVDAIREQALREERSRMESIQKIAGQHGQAELGERAIREGMTVDAFREALLESIGARKIIVDPSIGMSSREVQRFSFVRLINALATGNWKEAEFEREVSIATAERMHKEPQGAFVPMDVLAHRDLTVGTGSAGGYTVGTDLLGASFIDLLRNKMVLKQAGAKVLGGLIGDVAIPKQSGGATAYWVAESGSPTEGAQTFGQVAMTPKTCGAFTDISRKLRLQSSVDIDNLVVTDLATVVAIAIDLAGLHGSGTSNQPTGIASTSGIGSVAGGTNGLAPAYSHIISLETEVAQDNADLGSLAYITNAKVRGKLKQVFSNATYGEIPLWTKGSGPGIGELNGYPAYCTNQVSSALTKGSSSGVCSAIFFGNWGDLLIGQWGALDLNVDTSTGSTSGTVRVVALMDVDVAVRHPESFAAMLDALTT